VKRTMLGSVVAFGALLTFPATSNATDSYTLINTLPTTNPSPPPGPVNVNPVPAAWEFFQGGYSLSNTAALSSDDNLSYSFSAQSPPSPLYSSYTSSMNDSAGFGYSQSVFGPTPSPAVGSGVSAQVWPSSGDESASACGVDQLLGVGGCDNRGTVLAANAATGVYFFEVVPINPLYRNQVLPINVQVNALEQVTFSSQFYNTVYNTAYNTQNIGYIASASASIGIYAITGDIEGPSQIGNIPPLQLSYVNNSPTIQATYSSTRVSKPITQTISIFTDQIYAIELSTTAAASSAYNGWGALCNPINGVCSPSGNLGYSTTASALADPYLVIDPSSPNANQFEILVSPGFGNSPIAGAPSPTPGSGLLSIALILVIGIAARFRGLIV
jgi:hypothetical protein